MAWKGSFISCWLRLQSHTTRDPQPQFCIIRRDGSSNYELHSYHDVQAFPRRNPEFKFRIVVCPTPSEIRALIKTGQFNLFEEAPDADTETAPQTGE